MSDVGGIQTHPSVEIVWKLANCLALAEKAIQIEPTHFVLAFLLLMDDAAEEFLSQVSTAPNPREKLAGPLQECREQLPVSDKGITSARRSLQRHLQIASAYVRPEQMPLLHRSELSRACFDRGAKRAMVEAAAELRPVHLISEFINSVPKDVQALLTNPQSITSDSSRTAPSTPPGTALHTHVRTEFLDRMGRDLTAMANEGRLRPAIGRDKELKSIARYLQRTTKRNVLLIGEPGVGKTAIVEGLACKLADKAAPMFLRELRFVQINLADMVSGTQLRGMMEERIQRLILEAETQSNLVLFVDEIHMMMSAGRAGDSALDVANILKPALGRGAMRCIGATTTEEYERYLKSDGAFMRRFQVLRIEEQSPENSALVLAGWARHVEELQGVRIESDAIESAISLSTHFIPDRRLPDKAIDLVENAVAAVMVGSLGFGAPPKGVAQPRITRAHIVSALEEQLGIRIDSAEAFDVEAFRMAFEREICGQSKALDALLDVFESMRRRSADARPRAVLFFNGPSGVGKSKAGELIAQTIFGGTPAPIFRINMGELKERHDLSKLVGAPPGFIGHERAGSLFSFVESVSQGVILLDEMEKAHPEIQDYFLQIFDRGEARDSRGKSANLRSFIFVMTSNAPSTLDESHAIGFHPQSGQSGPSEFAAVNVGLPFRPEFLGRLDAIIHFRPLGASDYSFLLRGWLNQDLEAISVEEVDPAFLLQASEALSSSDDGVRGFRRRVEHAILNPLRKYFDHSKREQVRVRLAWRSGALQIEQGDLPPKWESPDTGKTATKQP